ncbi:ABC transporter-like protein [Bisporella sp. PMI_857]|nr:ABC transporter-like protein [Bisporella sp. PMI_857]
MSVCDPQADNVFGPRVAVSCRGGLDFTLLFEQAILSIVPSGIAIVASAAYLYHFWRQSVKTIPNAGWWLRISIWCYISVQLALIVIWAPPTNSPAKLSLPASVLSMIAGLLLAALSYFEHSRSVRPSAVLSIYLIFSILFDVAQARTLWLRENNSTVAAVFTVGLGLKVAILLVEITGKRQILKEPYSQYSPEALGGVLNRSLFWWLNSLLIKGSCTRLELDDLFPLDEKLTSGYVEPRIRRSWKSSTKNSTHALLLATLKCFWKKIITLVLYRYCFIAFNFCQPLLIEKTVSLLLDPDSPTKTNNGRALIGATALIYLGIALTTALFRHNLYRLITMIRGSIVGLIYATTLSLDTKTASESAALTLMSTDIEVIASGFEVFDSVWASPIEIGIATYLLYNQIGLAFIAPIVISLIFVSVSMAMRKVSGKAQRAWLEAIQRRVAATTSALSNMKGIKITGLSDCVEKELQDLRITELKVSARFRKVLGASTIISGMSQVTIPVITMITYVLVMRAKSTVNLNPTLAFTSLSLVSLLASPIQAIAKAVPQIAAAMACFQRIQTYISSCDTSQYTPNRKSNGALSLGSAHTGLELDSIAEVSDKTRREAIIVVKNGDFIFESIPDAILSGINISIVGGTWTVLTGPIGCGKSVLLLALLNELRLIKGSMNRRPSLNIGYCAQDPWLPNLSIQQLIIANTDFDETWYATVLNACVLCSDLKELPAGDQTVIGSNGVSLSGGQKQRLGLARAIYSRKQLLILDDVLGGLDPKTEEEIVNNVFGSNGLLRKQNVTVLLATHSVRHARRADNVIIMGKRGTIVEQGPPSTITRFNDVNMELQFPQDSDSLSASKNSKADLVEPRGQSELQLDPQDTQLELSRQNGDIRIYAYYVVALGWASFISTAVFICIYAVFLRFPTIWLNWWSNAETTSPGVHTNMYAGIYGMFCGICLISFSLAIFLLFGYGIPRSSNSLHARLLKATMQAPYWFFVSTDTGQILNRFSQDMSMICLQLPFAFLDTLFNAGVCIVGAVLIMLASKWAEIMYPALILILYVLQKFYLRTSRQIRLLDLEAKSPLYSNFLQTLQGLITIRAFGWQDTCIRENNALLDTSQRPFYLMYSIQRWLNLVLDLLVAGMATTIIALATQLNNSSAGAVGVSLVSILSFSLDLTYLIRTWTDLETSLGAISRVKSFEADTPCEHALNEKSPPPTEWPSEGGIEINGLSSSYKVGAALILKEISLRIPPGSKVGICGRTGSGKSTFILTLLRLAEIESGDILIDGISMKTIPRNTVRRRLVAMPQEPLLLSGTVRFNADPFSEHSNESILSALQEVGIRSVVVAGGGLGAQMDTIPLSRGQRQLFSLTRPILSKSRIVVLDEMTSSVDAATEAKMMEVVRDKFAGRTVVAVAHHLRTIRDFDKIVVLDQGRMIETGSPDELLARPSIFRELWDRQE